MISFCKNCYCSLLDNVCVCAGYNLSPQAMNCIMKRYSISGRIPFDGFVNCSVRLRALTGELFEKCMRSDKQCFYKRNC